MTDSQIKSSKTRYKKIWILVMTAIPLTLVGTYLFVTKFTGAPKDAGTFGDLFGLSNALFSGLAFSGIIYSIFLQQLELELTRDELKRTADAQTDSQKTLVAQAEQMIIASRLSAYGIMMNYYQEQMKKINVIHSPTHYQHKYSEYAKFTENTLDELIKLSEKENENRSKT